MYLQSAVFLMIVASVFSTECPSVTKGVKKYMVYIEEKKNWFFALNFCSSHGMSLATIESQEDQDKIKALLDPTCSGQGCHERWWIGGSDLHKTKDYLWFSTGQPIQFQNYAPGEPDNARYFSGETEHCLQIVDDYRWNDITCEHQSYFICEYFE